MRWRNDEVTQMIDALEGEYETAEDEAKAVLETAARLLRLRDSYSAVARMDKGLTLVYGPWWDKRAATKAAEAIPSGVVVKTFSSGGLEEKALPDPDERYCPEEDCKHPRIAHIDRPWKAYRARTMSAPGCMVPGCSCTRKS